MYIEMILDNDDIIDAMGDAEVQVIVDLLKVKKNPLYLEILCNLCECNETAKISHQNRLVRMLLENSKGVIYTTKLLPDGSDVQISKSGIGNDWQSLRAFEPIGCVPSMIYRLQFQQVGALGESKEG